MVQLVDMMEYLKKYPVFDDIIVRDKLDASIEYTHLYLHRLTKKGLITRIERNKYTVFDDPFLIASRIAWPSYISCWNALSYHQLTEQVPQSITVITTVAKKSISFNNTEIKFVKTSPKKLFGYEKVRYDSFEIFIADLEKSIIDSALLHKVSFSEIREIVSNHLKEIDMKRFLKYLIRTGNSSLIKRFGYLFELLGRNYYSKLKKYIQSTYTTLDYSKDISGKRDATWRVIINA